MTRPRPAALTIRSRSISKRRRFFKPKQHRIAASVAVGKSALLLRCRAAVVAAVAIVSVVEVVVGGVTVCGEKLHDAPVGSPRATERNSGTEPVFRLNRHGGRTTLSGIYCFRCWRGRDGEVRCSRCRNDYAYHIRGASGKVTVASVDCRDRVSTRRQRCGCQAGRVAAERTGSQTRAPIAKGHCSSGGASKLARDGRS